MALSCLLPLKCVLFSIHPPPFRFLLCFVLRVMWQNICDMHDTPDSSHRGVCLVITRGKGREDFAVCFCYFAILLFSKAKRKLNRSHSSERTIIPVLCCVFVWWLGTAEKDVCMIPKRFAICDLWIIRSRSGAKTRWQSLRKGKWYPSLSLSKHPCLYRFIGRSIGFTSRSFSVYE